MKSEKRTVTNTPKAAFEVPVRRKWHLWPVSVFFLALISVGLGVVVYVKVRQQEDLMSVNAQLRADLEKQRQELQQLTSQIGSLDTSLATGDKSRKSLEQEIEQLKRTAKEMANYSALLDEARREIAVQRSEKENAIQLTASLRKANEELLAKSPPKKKEPVRVVEKLETYKADKSREIVIGYRSGKRDEALVIGRELGFEVVEESRLLDAIIFRWVQEKPLTKETLDFLKTKGAVIRLVQPGDTTVEQGVHQESALLQAVEQHEHHVRMEKLGLPAKVHNDMLWGLHLIRAAKAWETIKSSEVTVAVIDSGIDYNHEDLRENIWRNPREIPDNGIDDDENGFVDDVLGYDFVDSDNDPMPELERNQDGNIDEDKVAHGTHCAGIIASVGRNGIGTVGVCWHGKIMAVRAKGKRKDGSRSKDRSLAEGIHYAVQNGARILNISWAGLPGTEMPWIEEQLQLASDKQVLVVCCAGNALGRQNNNDRPGQAVFPACYALDNIISVASVGPDEKLSSFSNYGPKSVHVAAPGGMAAPSSGRFGETDLRRYDPTKEIISTIPESLGRGKYAAMPGTSMATPHVSGAAALVWTHLEGTDGTANPIEVKKLLLENVRTKDAHGRELALKGKCASEGVLNLSFLAPASSLYVTGTVVKVEGDLAEISLNAFDGIRGNDYDYVKVYNAARLEGNEEKYIGNISVMMTERHRAIGRIYALEPIDPENPHNEEIPFRKDLHKSVNVGDTVVWHRSKEGHGKGEIDLESFRRMMEEKNREIAARFGKLELSEYRIHDDFPDQPCPHGKAPQQDRNTGAVARAVERHPAGHDE